LRRGRLRNDRSEDGENTDTDSPCVTVVSHSISPKPTSMIIEFEWFGFG